MGSDVRRRRSVVLIYHSLPGDIDDHALVDRLVYRNGTGSAAIASSGKLTSESVNRRVEMGAAVPGGR